MNSEQKPTTETQRTQRGLCTKSQNIALLCATSVFSVSLWLMNSEQKHITETQRTQRLHREISEPGLLRQSPQRVYDVPTRYREVVLTVSKYRY
jgi:hypothetical protein